MAWLDRVFLRVEVARNPYYGSGAFDVVVYHERQGWHATMRLTDRWLRKQRDWDVYRLLIDAELSQLLIAARLTNSREVPSNGPFKVSDGAEIIMAA